MSFKPQGIPIAQLENVLLNLDELETIRLADFEGLYHERTAGQMNISRATFGRILESARRKITDAILNGKAIKIELVGRVVLDKI
ncbi:MAG: DUF134 domain-containing protein [Syntrophorhabdaceae bacterium]|nr:DUF134 domain-containing protein [Syntrophorhabdaceae bacterium]MBV6506682.1 hypothetical protein [Syntrophorhabdaceae bacterium]